MLVHLEIGCELGIINRVSGIITHPGWGSTSRSRQSWRWGWQSSSPPGFLSHSRAPQAQCQSTGSLEAWGWAKLPGKALQTHCPWRSPEWMGRSRDCGSWFPVGNFEGGEHILLKWCTGVETRRSLGSALCWFGWWCPRCSLGSAWVDLSQGCLPQSCHLPPEPGQGQERKKTVCLFFQSSPPHPIPPSHPSPHRIPLLTVTFSTLLSISKQLEIWLLKPEAF